MGVGPKVGVLANVFWFHLELLRFLVSLSVCCHLDKLDWVRDLWSWSVENRLFLSSKALVVGLWKSIVHVLLDIVFVVSSLLVLSSLDSILVQHLDVLTGIEESLLVSC